MITDFFKKTIMWALLSYISVTYLSAQTLPVPDVFSPSFSHLSGRYSSDIQVELSTSTTNATIYYTLDGTNPTSSSQEYTDNISIAGDGNFLTIKAIAIRNDTLSLISSSTYIIDYDFNPNANYLTNLTWTEYNEFIKGDWFGYASTPWTKDYSVKLSILDNGNYIDETTSTSGNYPFDDIFGPVFYYGISAPSPDKTIALYDILPSGFANGFIDIVFSGGNTNTDQLRFIKFIDNRNLYLEMWHNDTYGPLKYYLTKKDRLITSTNGETIDLKNSFYPNPTRDFLNIKNINSEITLTNHLGKVYHFDKSERISLSHIPAGVYIISFRDNQGNNVKDKLFIK